MYDDFLVKNSSISASSNNLDNLFDSLTSDIDNFNKYINDINRKQKENTLEQQELLGEKARLEKAKMDFENYIKAKNDEYNKRIEQADSYLDIQKQNLLRSELEFKKNMEKSLNELELARQEYEIEIEKFEEEKEQFKKYKNLEAERIRNAEEALISDRNQFEKYKDITNKKIELESKSLEQKCDKFKQLISDFNSNFRPVIKEEEVDNG